MAIRYECDQCGSVLKIKDDLAGKPGKCPKCKKAFTVPAGEEEADGTGEVAAETSNSAEAAPSESRSSNAGDDFDVDAFLSSDDDSNAKPQAAVAVAVAVRKTQEVDPDQSLDDSDDAESNSKAKQPKPQSEKNGAKDKFEIRRGPDVPGKNTSVTTEAMDDESDNPPAPSRRPPGTNPNAAAANIASDLLSKSAKKGKKTNWSEVQPQKREEPGFDWDALKYEARTKLLPVGAGGGVVFLLIYFVVFPMFGGKGYAPKLAPVTGTVKIDGKPLVGAEVWFHPEQKQKDAKGKPHKVSSSFGKTDASGRFELTYSEDHKGAAIGKCRIEIVAAPTDYAGILKKYYRPDAENRPVTVEVKPSNPPIDLELTQ